MNSRQRCRRALQGVPEVFRSAVIMRDLEGMSYEEVAEVLGVSVGTVKSRILRGRRLLREILEPILQNSRAVHGQIIHETVRGAADVTKKAAQDQSEMVMHSLLFPKS